MRSSVTSACFFLKFLFPGCLWLVLSTWKPHRKAHIRIIYPYQSLFPITPDSLSSPWFLCLSTWWKTGWRKWKKAGFVFLLSTNLLLDLSEWKHSHFTKHWSLGLSLFLFTSTHNNTEKVFPFLYTLNFCADLDQFILGLSWFFMIVNLTYFHRPCGQPFSEEKTSGKTDRRTTTRNRYFSKLLSQWQCVCVCVRLWLRVHEGKLLSEAQNPTVSF